MKERTFWITLVSVAALILIVGGAGAASRRLAPAATLTDEISYQGRLTDSGGVPFDGTFDMRFQLYDAETSGTMLWDSGTLSVQVTDGLFSVKLNVDSTLFNGQALWLRTYVDGEWISARQELMPVPYALSLRPGAQVVGEPLTSDGAVVDTSLSGYYPNGKAVQGVSLSTGTAIWGESADGFGVYGYSQNSYGVLGSSLDSWGGYFSSNEGYGLRARSNGTDHWDHAGYFSANWGYGVYGESTQNYGVVGDGGMAGVRGTGQTAGVSGSSTDGSGVSGWSTNYRGVYGSSTDGNGVEGSTWRSDNNYGLFTYDNLYSNNYHLLGAVMHVAQNGGDAPLEPGDLVVFSGMGAAPGLDGAPVVQVAKTSSGNDPAVAGVVHSRFNVEAVIEGRQPGGKGVEREVTLEGAVPPGEYLLLVVEGPTQVKVSALSQAIGPGDLLSSAGQPGYAAKAAEAVVDGISMAAPGTVLGKALEPLSEGAGLIYVFVTLQ